MNKLLVALLGIAALVAPLSAQIISPGKTLSWSANGQTGSLRIGTVNGAYFEAEQTNEMNQAVGVVRLYGAVLDNGRRVVLINGGPWKEVWEGSLFEHEITGNLMAGSARFPFKIVEPMAATPCSFVAISAARLVLAAGSSVRSFATLLSNCRHWLNASGVE